ncbi:MAG: NADP-dependent oxidoreductase [Bacteroidota bacterium]|jgi:NADPH:quinone reductase-like Zn-dependent oxidoreductase
MKAAIYRKYGKSDVMRIEEIELAPPGKGEVQVRVHAAGVNPVDWKVRNGILRWLPLYRLPIVPGMDVSGIVESVGEGVISLKPGDQVFGFVNSRGCYAEYVNTAVEKLMTKPEKMSFEEAAGLSLAGLTALQSLKLGGIKKGDKVLITGASGGVGYFAVQMAVALGANVTAVCRQQNFPLIEGLACVRLVDNETEDWTALDEQFDIVFDTVANKSFAQAWKRMKKGATMITTMPNNGFLFYKPLSWFSGKKLCFIMIHSDRKDLQMMIDLYESGQLRVNVEHVFSLNEAAAAMDKSEFGRVRGKVVIKVH